MTKPGYKMSFTSGGLFLTESIAVAKLHQRGEDWEQTLQHARQSATMNLPKAASNRRSLREIVNRLECLSDVEIDFLAYDADRPEAQAVLWVATCRAYRFVREFVIEVVGERYLSYKMDVPNHTFDLLLDAKAEWDEGLAGLTSSTRVKLRQVLFRMMREAGILSTDNQILPAILSGRVSRLLEESTPSDLQVFPGVVRGTA